MDTRLLDILQCQSCHAGIRLVDRFLGGEASVEFGIVCCDCAEYPVVAGILDLVPGAVSQQLRLLLREGQFDSALALALTGGELAGPLLCTFTDIVKRLPGVGRFMHDLTFWVLMSAVRRLSGSHDSSNLPFCEVVGNTAYSYYLKHRFSLDNFWLLLPCLPLLRGAGGRILDLCCGAGHASYVISQTVQPDELVSADRTFKSLYLAKKYMTPEGHHICLDAGAPLPFYGGVFSSIVIMDAMHYIPARQLLASEVERGLTPDGVALLLHLHNAFSSDEWHHDGFPLSPDQWKALFRRLDARLIPEEAMLEDFLQRDILDLAQDYSQDRLQDARALCLIGSASSETWRETHQAGDMYYRACSRLAVNPFYEIKRHEGRVYLTRTPMDSVFRARYALANACLPETVILPGALSSLIEDGRRQVRPWGDSEDISQHVTDLVRQFVLINTPANYCQ